MSYILDALQKASAERQQVVHTEENDGTVSVPAPLGIRPIMRRWSSLWLTLAAGAGLVAILWWLFYPAAPTQSVAAEASPSAALVPPALVTPSAVPGSSPLPSPGVLAADTPILLPTPQTPSAPTRPTPATPSDTSSLHISGATFSDNPEHRMLILNGQVAREGQDIQPGLVLEVIGPRSAIFNDRGRRFNLNY